MSRIQLSKSFVPISEFKARATDWLKELNADDEPVVVTQNGRPAAVVLSPRAYDELTEKMRFLEAVQAGLDDVAQGRVIEHEAVLSRLGERFGAE